MKEAGLIKSTSEGRRAIKDGGVRIDGEKITPELEDYPVGEKTEFVLQIGKRKFVRVIL
jgi:tyrosyl-tRNA synthetase